MEKYLQDELDRVKKARENPCYLGIDELTSRIREEKFTVKELGCSYRQINIWDSKNLLCKRYDERKWRKFSLVEYTWIKIIMETKHLNIGLKTISRLKKEILFKFPIEEVLNNPEIDLNEIMSQFAPEGQSEEIRKLLTNPEIIQKIAELRFNRLEQIIIDILLVGNSYSILIGADSEIIILKYSFLEKYSEIPEFNRFINKSFVCISVTEILRNFILEKELDEKKSLRLLTKQETEVMDCIRKEGLKSVIIRFDNKRKINLLEEVREEKMDKASRLAEIVMSKGYQDITIKVQDGRIVFCENINKKRIKDN